MNRTDIPDWALARSSLLNRFSSLDMPHTAIINIDLQNAFVDPDAVLGNAHAKDVLNNINDLSRAVRTKGGLVAWTRQTYTEEAPAAPPDWHYDMSDPWVRQATEALRTGTNTHALHAGTEALPEDTVIDKHRYSALACPRGGLKAWLDQHGIDTLIITGTLTNCCCESTARDAHAAGYKVLFVSDATAASTDEEHNAALLNLVLNFADVRTTGDILKLIALS